MNRVVFKLVSSRIYSRCSILLAEFNMSIFKMAATNI